MKLPNKLQIREAGQAIGVLVVLLAIIGIGVWLLYSYRNGMRDEGRAFGRQVIERVAVQHDANFLATSLAPQARLNLPPPMQQELMDRLRQLGTPVGQPNAQGDVTFESQFFEPHGAFYAQLNYPAGSMRMDVAISHPVGRWQVDSITLSTVGAR
ncbi:MAG TPA: hypothetical protein VFO30_06525 [Chthoniobacterales bacterium]|nr:hypothetical protein [Chthoniobacterales bacterium]